MSEKKKKLDGGGEGWRDLLGASGHEKARKFDDIGDFGRIGFGGPERASKLALISSRNGC
jgi:hypothetical protein